MVRSAQVPIVFCVWPFIAGLVGCSIAAPAQSSQGGRIQIRVYDYVSVTSKILNEAKSEASRVLLVAGLETDWRLAALSATESAGLAEAPRMQPTTFVLRILDRHRSEN